MAKNKFGMMILLGAFIGGAASFLDKTTREEMIGKTKKTISTVQYYAQNKEQLTDKFQQEKIKYEGIINKFSNDVTYIKDRVDDIRQLTPEMKELVSDTKEAFMESKNEMKSIIEQNPQS